MGENFNGVLAQVKESVCGKVLRYNDDGTIPQDNPFPGSPVYSLGHRNIFGLAFHPKTGRLYISEEGPDANDEINLIQKGGNYGWPIVTGRAGRPEFIDPIHVYARVVTLTQLAFYGEDLLVPTWNTGHIHRLKLAGEDYDRVTQDDIVYRYRPWGLLGIFVGPERELYVTTPDGIEKISIS
jgi:aldose sugar dehydrogenase